MRPDHLLEQHKRGTRSVRDADQPRQAGRDLHDREPRIGFAGRRLENHDEIETERREQRKRTGTVDRERCQHREHGFAKECAQGCRIAEALERDEPDLALGQSRQQIASGQIVEGDHELVASLSHGLQLQRRRESRQIDGCVGLCQRLLEAGHTNHEELVEVRRGDGDKLDALEQRRARVGGLLEDALIECEPRQLAIDEQRAGNLRRHGVVRAGCTISCRPNVSTNMSARAVAASRSMVRSPVPSSWRSHDLSLRTIRRSRTF